MAKVVKPLIMIALSTVLYYSGVLIVDMGEFDVSIIDKKFYLFYCVYTSGLLLTIACYAVVLYSEIPIHNLKAKIIYLYLMITEIYTFIKHIINKILGLDIYRGSSILATLVTFTICCIFIVKRAHKKLKSDKFNPGRTYIINYLPKDFKGMINYLIRLSGHKAIFQDGFITGFSRSTGTITQRLASPEKIMKAYLKEIPRVSGINSILGRQYSLIKFNCNHLENYANRN